MDNHVSADVRLELPQPLYIETTHDVVGIYNRK